MQEETQQKNIWLLIASLLLMAMGIYVIFSPETALMASAMVLGIMLIMVGFGYLFGYRISRIYYHPIIGILDILVGVVMLVNLGITAISIPFIFGFWCLFTGITYIVEGMRLKKTLLPMSGMTILVGFLGVLFGTLTFLYPILGMLSVSFLLGSYMIIYGAFELGRYRHG